MEHHEKDLNAARWADLERIVRAQDETFLAEDEFAVRYSPLALFKLLLIFGAVFGTVVGTLVWWLT